MKAPKAPIVAALVLGGVLLDLGSAELSVASSPAEAALAQFIDARTFGVGTIAMSPDGKRLLFPVCGFWASEDGSLETSHGQCRLNERNLQNDEVSIWVQGSETQGLETWMFASWSPSGREIAFIADAGRSADRGGTLFVRPANGGSRAIAAANERFPPMWLNDHQVLYVSRPEQVENPLHDKDEGNGIRVYHFEPDETPESELRSDFDHPQFSGRLEIVDVTTGRSREVSEKINFGVSFKDYVALSPRRDALVYALRTGEPDQGKAAQATYEIRLLNLSGQRRTRTIAAVVDGPFGFRASWSMDGRYIAWIADNLTDTGTLYVYDTRTNSLHRHAAADSVGSRDASPTVPWHMDAGSWTIAIMAGMGVLPPVWVDDHRIVMGVYRGPRDAPPTQKKPREIWTVDVRTGAATRLWGSANEVVLGIVPAYRGSRALQMKGQIVIRVADALHNESWRLLDVASGTSRKFGGNRPVSFYSHFSADLPRGSPDGTAVLALMQSGTIPANLWTFPLDGSTPRQLTHLNPDLSTLDLGTIKAISYNGPDGGKYRAALILPPFYRAGCPVPLVVDVYYVNDRSWAVNQFGVVGVRTDNALILSSQGYAVLAPDVKVGASGNHPRDITDYVLAGVDEVIRLGYADDSRLAITGHSYGGYSVYSVIANTTRFKAAVVRSGFADWITQYLTLKRDGRIDPQAEGIRGPGKTLWTNLDGYILNSPLFEFDRVRTPTLIVHGTEDYLSVFNAKAAYVALKRLGKPVSLALYQGEQHSQSAFSRDHQIDYGERMLSWYRKYLGSPSPAACAAGESVGPSREHDAAIHGTAAWQ